MYVKPEIRRIDCWSQVAKHLLTAGHPAGFAPSGGGRTWWAHLEFTRMNITPTIHRKKIEEWLILGAFSRF